MHKEGSWSLHVIMTPLSVTLLQILASLCKLLVMHAERSDNECMDGWRNVCAIDICECVTSSRYAIAKLIIPSN